MSVLSTITSSLPNVLNILQGKWDVQYKVGIKPEGDDASWLQEGRDLIQKGIDFMNGAKPTVDKFEWKSVAFDSFIDLQEIQDTNITQNPIEQGSFRSTNKVRKPKQIKVTLAKAGVGYGIEDSLAEIKMLLPLARYGGEQIQRNGISEVAEKVADFVINGVKSALGASENPKPKVNFPMEFRILTPFDMITNLNLIKMDYTFKKDSGRNMFLVYLTFQEVLETSSGVKALKVSNPTDSENTVIGRLTGQK